MQNREGSRHSEHFPFLAQIEVLPEWESAARRFLAAGGIAMVLGAADTGKSTFCRYLIYRSYLAGEPAALVDLDLGQSHLGPPATLGLGLFPPRRPGDDGLFPEGVYFIGQTSPVGAILEVAVGCRALVDQAARRGVSRVVVNTSGLVQGLAALRLKRAEIELLKPSLIFALEREGELEPLLRGLGWVAEASSPLGDDGRAEGKIQGEETSPLQKYDALVGAGSPRPQGNFPPCQSPGPNRGTAFKGSTTGRETGVGGWPLVRLPVSSQVISRSPAERRAYREERFRRYFHQARRLTLPWRSLVWEGLPGEQETPLSEAAREDFAGNLGGSGLSENSQACPPGPLPAQEPQVPGKPDPKTSPEGGTAPQFFWSGLQLRLVGLLSATRGTLALGVILPSPGDPEMVALWTPLLPGEAPRVRFLKVGKLTLNLEGRELSQV